MSGIMGISNYSSSSPKLALILLIAIIADYCCLAKYNVIDECWRPDPNWRNDRHKLAKCSVGFAGKMTNNVDGGLVRYEVTDPSDDPLNPKPGTLRYGVTMIKQRSVWITFQKDMSIHLQRPLLIGSFTTIDGRGASVHIAGPACLLIYKATDVIIHGIRIHHCKPQPVGPVMGPGGTIMPLGQMDGDAIRLVTARKVWIDHNTMYQCQDGLLDVTRGTTDVTVSNNWFRNQDKVMLLGHDDGFVRDKHMKVTVAFNHFGPKCNQRMPRVRHGYAHVANNFYLGWEQYAIGGSSQPSIKSEANYFVAPAGGRKEVTWRSTGSTEGRHQQGSNWNFYSVRDVFENGALFSQTGARGTAKPNYSPEQAFPVADAKFVRELTSSAGALRCSNKSRC